MKLPLFTIERLRTLILIGGGILIVAIAVFLTAGQWKRRFFSSDLPKRLGADIVQQANGVDYTQSRKGKTLFKIHAARAVQLKQSGKMLLHDVRIDLYGEDGNRTDTISGSEFEYDTNLGVAQAAGAVEIAMMRPGVKPAIAQLKPGSKSSADAATPKTSSNSGDATNQITDSEIHVKTSGLSFNQRTGIATTPQRVDFALRQGSGSSVGATYDSGHNQLVLDHAVELHVDRIGGPVTVHASHAEFVRAQQSCQLTDALAEYSNGSAKIGDALIHFRDDGSVTRLDGTGGVDLKTVAGGHLAAPRGTLDFDANNHPRSGLLVDGTRMDLTRSDRTISGTSPTVRLVFDSQGELHQAHMERGVFFSSEQKIPEPGGANGAIRQVHRTWKSQIADVDFVPVPSGEAHPAEKTAQNRVEPRTIHGSGGVIVTSETTSNGVILPSKLAADLVVAELDAEGSLSNLTGNGHASFEQRTAAGVHQSSSSDQLDVSFIPKTAPVPRAPVASAKSKEMSESEIASVHQIGHVVITQEPAPPRVGAGPQQQAGPIRAAADRADYDGQSQVLRLSGAPRIHDGGLDMTANQIDFSRASGDSFAHGDVKASWTGRDGTGSSMPGSSLLGGASGPAGNGSAANGPIHAVAAEAELHQSTQEVIFHNAAQPGGAGQSGGNQPRIWEGANSISAPMITLNRQKQTLFAQSNRASNPVRTVLVSNPKPKNSDSRAKVTGLKTSTKAHADAPSVIRLASGDLHYSEAERVALLHGGAVGRVTAETTDSGGVATVVSQEAEVHLMPADSRNRTGTATVSPRPNASTGSPANTLSSSSVDRLIARDRVTITWPDRNGTGDKLVYLSEDGTFTLTGTAAVPPRITDQVRGTVTGSALIFHGGDDSVTVEGGGAKTVTETRSPK